jgi:general nucleoside transport system permease protein
MNDVLGGFLEASVRTATPLLLAATGELLVQRAGIVNIGLEGIIIAGCLGGLMGASAGGVAAGFAGAVVAGVLVAVIFAIFVVLLRADQIVTGTAITMLALGATGALYHALYGAAGAALDISTLGASRVPVLADIPVVGAALFGQPLTTPAALLLVPVVWLLFFRTHAGLALRAVGEAPDAAIAAGVSTARVRTVAILAQGVLGGLAGGTLVLAQAGTFAEGMSAGRGFIAIAVVVLGRWHPVGVLVAALVFGAASALQFLIQTLGLPVPYQLVLALPYALALLALAGVAGRVRAPAALARES